MIVVGMIAILSAISIPLFRKFQSRSRQTEAKISLKAYFTAAKTSYAETTRWRCGACGWSPQDRNYAYNYYLSSTTRFDAGKRGCGPGVGEPAGQTDPDFASNSAGGFTAEATANLDVDTTCDAWNINDAADLTNPSNDVEY